jgi:hypothetical protein
LAAAETIISVIGGFVTAVIAGLLLRLWIEHFFRPILVIDGNDTIQVVDFHPKAPDGIDTLFRGNRIRVRNAGRSAAKDCKTYIRHNENDIRRAAWLIPDNNVGYTLTLNVQDNEFADLCCIRDDGQLGIIPTEQGYIQKRFDAYVPLEDRWGIINVRITSSNAGPLERTVRLHTAINHFRNQHGRIVEFI